MEHGENRSSIERSTSVDEIDLVDQHNDKRDSFSEIINARRCDHSPDLLRKVRHAGSGDLEKCFVSLR